MRRDIPERILGLDGTHAVGGTRWPHVERGERNDQNEAVLVVLHFRRLKAIARFLTEGDHHGIYPHHDRPGH